MEVKAVIEIPKGVDKRIHYNPQTKTFIDLGPIKNSIPVNEGVMPVAYGFIEGAINPRESDEIDVLVFSKEGLKTGQKIEIEPIALIVRDDGDDKVVAVDATMATVEKWTDIAASERKLVENYFGFKHKITAIKNASEAKGYIKVNTIG